MLSDKNVVATKVGNRYTESDTFNFFKDAPQLKQFLANELCTTLHFLHSLDISEK